MFLLIDNFDSFTFNLVQTFQQQGKEPVVVKNDRPELLEMAGREDLAMVCISPGPSRPENAGLCLEFLKLLPPSVPVLGVCLGHQILGHHAGCVVDVAERIMHGKTSFVHHGGRGVFRGVPGPTEVCRYHSLLVDVPDGHPVLEVTARTAEGEVMGLRYRDRPWVGVQFHPESILTPDGPAMLANFPDNAEE
jgi:anthranilate synthase component 2